MSRGFTGNEKCVFCGWTRRSAFQAVRFFAIPKDPGLKRVRWLQVFGDREISPKDRVCSVHFRQGRPSSDPSHEDFVPHLYLNNEPPPEVLDYLESLADAKPEKIPVPTEYVPKAPSSTVQSSASQPKNVKVEVTSRNPKPSILKRRRAKADQGDQESQEPIEAQAVDEEEFQNSSSQIQLVNNFDHQENQRPMKLTLIQRQIADAVGLRPGQSVIIRRRIIKK